MYNEIKKIHSTIASLQGKIIILEKKLDEEGKQRRGLEAQVGDIPNKLQNYEESLKNLIKNSEKGIQGATSSLLVAIATIGKDPQGEVKHTGLPLIGRWSK